MWRLTQPPSWIWQLNGLYWILYTHLLWSASPPGRSFIGVNCLYVITYTTMEWNVGSTEWNGFNREVKLIYACTFRTNNGNQIQIHETWGQKTRQPSSNTLSDNEWSLKIRQRIAPSRNDRWSKGMETMRAVFNSTIVLCPTVNRR